MTGRNTICSLILTFSLLLPCMSGLFVHSENQMLSVSPSETIIITWYEGVSSEDRAETLSPYNRKLSISYEDENFTICELNNPADAPMLLSSISAARYVLAAEPDSDIELFSISNDYYSGTQWSFDNTGSYTHIEGTSSGTLTSTPDVDIDAPEAWVEYAISEHDRRRVIVAVIDTGIDYKHPDLANSMWTNPGEIPDNGIDDDNNGYIDDVYGWDFYNNDSSICAYEYNERLKAYLSSAQDCDDHGTHCAGIIAATANNKIGIAGAASCADVKLMSLKIHGGPDRKGGIPDAIKAISYAERMGARICNMSWGSYVKSTSLFTAMERSNMLFITAAGNDGTNNDDKPLYPASFELPNCISVTYVDANGKLTAESNYGQKSVDIAVPSTDIFSTIVGTYTSLSGSSMAAPHVTAIAALLYSYHDGLFASNIKEIILGTHKPIAALDGFIKYAGIPSAYYSLVAADSLVSDTIAPTMSIKKSYDGAYLKLSFNPADEGGSEVHTLRYFIGNKKLSAFNNGTLGTVITNNTLSVSKAGIYTFYLTDYAGNVLLKPFYVLDDTIAPSIHDSSYYVYNNYSKIKLTAYLQDTQSGVKTVKYLAGKHTAVDFKSTAGTVLVPDKNGKVSFKVKKEGIYTIYACDYRGNKSVSYVNAYIRKATSLALNNEKKTLYTGKTYTLKATLLPAYSTDHLTYTSSDTSIAKVSSTGKVTAIAPGKAVITCKASSGVTDTCTITVKKAK